VSDWQDGGGGCIQGVAGTPEGGDTSWEHLGVDWRIVLKWVGWGRGFDWFGSGYRQVVGFCGHGDEPSDFIKSR
jgi:hypothetical protein